MRLSHNPTPNDHKLCAYMYTASIAISVHASPRRTPAGPIPSPLLSSGPRALAPRDLPPSRSLPLLSAPEVLPLSRSLQALPASPSSSPLLLSGPEALASTRLPPSQSSSLQQLPTRPSPDLPRGSRGLTPKGPTQPQVLRLRPCQSLTLPSGPGILPPTRSPPPQSLTQSATLPSPSRPLQPPLARSPPSQSLLPAQGPAVPQAAESQPPAPLPVFQSIRRQLALSKAQGTPSPAHDDCRPQPRSALAKSSPRNAPSRGPLVPLGQREHAWLVAMSAGCWAQVRGLFLEEPELALQRDFIPLARSASSVSKVSPFTGRAALPACLRVQLGRGAVSDQSGSDSD
ncbi:vegetative cell wall protein gp1-like [Geospiza fortis]|uniref:Vegetative cell wall protein gp1-like n=1 Tax=Geospiza fortis TaxID=48883 RepID=A0A8N5I3N0_GEOFO|nr:vegetative cell wall protein gp1-like [Geospiza fortis]